MSWLVILAALTSAVMTQVPQGTAAQSPAELRIVVIAGEGAVNVIQQKSAVAPIVEVRDRNDQPVAGVVVRFAVQSGRATFGGGAQTLTVTTNAAGRAVAAGLTPTGSGALQIGASATFQGQAAAVTIAQSNVMTAAEAVAAGSASGASGGSGGTAGAGAAGGGGGMSGTTLGIIGAAVGGGAVAATTVLQKDDDGITYSGSYSGQATDVLSPNGACAITQTHTGTVTIKLSGSGSVNGTGEVEGTMTVIAGSTGCPTGTPLAPVGSTQNHGCCNPTPTVGGTPASLSFSGNHPGGTGTNWFYDFTGVLNDPEITGTFTLTTTYQNNQPGPTVRVFPVRLTRAQ